MSSELPQSQLYLPTDNKINFLYRWITAGRQGEEECKQMHVAQVTTNRGSLETQIFIWTCLDCFFTLIWTRSFGKNSCYRQFGNFRGFFSKWIGWNYDEIKVRNQNINKQVFFTFQKKKKNQVWFKFVIASLLSSHFSQTTRGDR